MLRLMVMRQAVAAAVMLLVAACGSGTGAQDNANPERERLLAAADAAAKRNDGEARRVEVVKTTRGEAADLTGHSNQAQGEEVWVVQVSGDDYVCDGCSRPAGATSPEGRFMTLVLRVSDFEGTDFGMSPRATDLARYGEVEVLRDDG
jgi:hypothetical protein